MTAANGDKALANGRSIGSGYSGMCQKFVREKCWQVPSLYGSAIDAWNGADQKHPDDRTPPVGAPCYYRGNQYGHVVIATGGGKVARSTDCTSTNDISEVDVSWFETNWGYEYLGWTGDLNGVDLPLAADQGQPDDEDEEMDLNQEITLWSPDEGGEGKTTVGKTLNQARGYSEDAYDRIKQLQSDVAAIKKALGVK